MSPQNGSKWFFEKVDPNISGSSGKITDLFRNEGLEDRGHLKAGAPGVAATLMAREVIQNSWDAAQELRNAHPQAPMFAIDFHFEAFSGSAKDELIRGVALEELADHARAVAPTTEERGRLGLGTGDCLLDLETREAVEVCRIVEHGATGMYGPWSGADSRMYLAMLSIGYRGKEEGSGGTFGYGKAGLIRASHSRIVLAYSCFLERPDDRGVTRRLLGVTYWDAHKRDRVSYRGFVRFGHQGDDDQVPVPFENEQADEVAAALGFEVRDPDVLEQLGTSFLVIDPSVAPENLRVAIERNWWPALLDERFNVLITEPDGKRLFCRPRKNAQLEAFVEAYDHMHSGAQPSVGRVARLRDLGSYAPQGETTRELGQLTLIADPEGWSFPDETSGDGVSSESRSLVALSREPRMIVEYHLPGRDISRRVPFVRGVFLASPDVNVHLSKTEPKAHDKWDTRESGDDVPVLATRFASVILDRIKTQVKLFQDELRPPVDETGAVRLSRLDERLSKLRNEQGTKQPPPPRGDRPFSFRLDVQRSLSGSGLTLSGHVDVRLADDADADELPARIRLAFALEEDGKRGSIVPLEVSPPAGFGPVDGDGSRFEGVVTRHPVRFDLTSEPYRADWTGELLVTGERVEEEEAT
jgi:hypothetical protein